MQKVFLGSDHAGFDLKENLKAGLLKADIEIEDLGTYSHDSCDYPVIAHKLAARVLECPGTLGVLVCGTGLGMSMAANRHRGVRAAVCTSEYMAEMARRHNDANVLCLGSRVLGEGLAKAVLAAFLRTEFEAGRHARRVEQLDA